MIHLGSLKEIPLEPPPTAEDAVISALLSATSHIGSIRNTPDYIGPGDDAACLKSAGVLTVDSLIEGVHWNQRLSPQDVGYKTIAVSVSDLAAMGARPSWALLSLALPRPVDAAWVDAFAAGMAQANAQWDIALVGGDTTRSPGPIMISLTLGGTLVARPLQRCSAQVGDTLWVTGTLGLAAAGYHLKTPPEDALQALRRPAPPLEFALALASQRLASACMDLSDGLRVDLHRLCTASKLGAVIHSASLPLSQSVQVQNTPLALAVSGGEDYQLLFTSSEKNTVKINQLARSHALRCTPIGRLQRSLEVRLDSHSWPPALFSHFSPQ